MHRGIAGLIGSLALMTSLIDGGGVVAQRESAVPDDLSATVDNPFFPLAPGSSRRYEGQEVDPDTGETVDLRVREHVSPVPDEIAGAPVTTLGVQAAQRATQSIPIVMIAVPDPIGEGFAVSFSKPGKNITGLSNIGTEVSVKHLELLHTAVPKLSLVAVLINPLNPSDALILEQIHGAIAFYLSQRQEVDSYLSSRSKRWDALRTASEAGHAGLLHRVRTRAGKSQDDAT